MRGFKIASGCLAVRHLIPEIPSLKMKPDGIPCDSPHRYLTSVWAMIATIVLLLLVWLAFSEAAKNASAEFEALRNRVASA